MRLSGLLHLCINSRIVQPRLIGALILALALFTSCSKLPYKPKVLSHQQPNLNALYNKPYRVKGTAYYPLPAAAGYKAEGVASWHGSEYGNITAMGTRFIPENLTAAHRTLPLPTKVRVTNLKDGHFVDVLVNDRGPFKDNRLIDLSHGAARKIGLQGLARVKIDQMIKETLPATEIAGGIKIEKIEEK